MLPDHIQISSSPDQDLQQFIDKKKYSKILVLTDENTHKHCLPVLKSLSDYQYCTIKSGEENKTIETCESIWEIMTAQQLDRHSAIIVMGGGVLGDMGGFCAATYKRGIDFILIPTTLLSQVDASIGGKLGVDFKNFKNHIGVFKEPALNLIYQGFLKTLPPSELRSGFAEVIKHAIISDRSLWLKIREKSLANQDWPALLKHSAKFKYSVISEDPTEKGVRKILNAGHTIGHALESYFLKAGKKITHGEAVAAGLVTESFIAKSKGMLTSADLNSVSTYILGVFGKLDLPEGMSEKIVELCRQDKKNKGTKILAALPDGIGKAKWDCEITKLEIEHSLAFYRSL